MLEQQNPYNQPPQGPMMPPPQMPRRRAINWMQRLLEGSITRPLSRRVEYTIPNWVVSGSVAVFFIAFGLCILIWGYPMDARYAIISSISLLLFFNGGKAMLQGWIGDRERVFVRNVFVAGLSIRLLWSFYCYFFFNPDYYGNTFGEIADVQWYMPFGAAIADWVRDGFSTPYSELTEGWGAAFDDTGYPVWLAILNLLSFGESDVFVPFVVKCILGALSGVFIYRIAKRHFGIGAARLAALFVALNPNMIYWCGNMFKETEMVFLCCMGIDFVDRTFSSGGKLTFRGLLPGILAGTALFFFRTALGMVFFLAMFAHVVMASNRVMSLGKKIIAGFLVGVVLLVGMGDRLRTQTEKMVEMVQSDSQQKNMEWRETRKDVKEGKHNKLITKYASATVFAPLIFTIPFPTFNTAYETQVLQAQLSGGNYIKNICSYFVILVMFIMLISGEWRKHVFILAYTVGYLMVLVMSNFAHSSRFHMPIWPMLMLFAAYGIQLSKTNPTIRRWFPLALGVEIVACLVWNWFKLAGRGMI